MAVPINDQHLNQIKRDYMDFLDDGEDQGLYSNKVREMISSEGIRLIVNINDLRKKKEERARNLLNSAFDELIAFQDALKEYVSSLDSAYIQQFNEFYVGFEGSFGAKHVSPRTLSARNLGNLVCVEGIVTKCSLVRPKVVRSVHYCPATKKTLDRKYTDLTSYDAFPSSAIYPTKDEEGNILETEYGLSLYKDHQTLTIQEMPEKAPTGQLPRSVDIVTDNDLVDVCKPGDRVQIVGVYRCLPSKQGSYTSGTFRTILLANNILVTVKDVSPKFSPVDVARIRKFSSNKRHDVFEQLSKSLAPSIHGHEYIKQALLCMLLGGQEKVLENGTRLRGDINILLIGDPSVAKSQLLRYVLHTAPRSIATTGRGSSGVGLTAAVTTDQETGERRLEAGAMVLADRGVVCIDEFDKMSDIDRTAIHEVMEQGRVTIAKAGIHATLNARCSVLAAANPVYGRYDEYKTPMENIGLQDSLLSRFDLLFIVLDQMDADQDRSIADHVLRVHRYRSMNEQDGDILPLGVALDTLTTQDIEIDDDLNDTPVYEKYDALLHGTRPRGKGDKFVSMKFMRKYIHIARGMKPKLTQKSCDFIAEEYSKLRNQDNSDNYIAKTQPITARCLETVIRLSTAHAKARLSKTVDLEDAEAAMDMIHYAYFKKVMQKDRHRKHKTDDVSDDGDDVAVDASQSQGSSRKSRATTGDSTSVTSDPKPGSTQTGYDPYSFNEDTSQPVVSLKSPRSTSTDTLPDHRFNLFKAALFKAFNSQHAQSLEVDRITELVNAEPSGGEFTNHEILTAINTMQDANQLMLSDHVVFLI